MSLFNNFMQTPYTRASFEISMTLTALSLPWLLVSDILLTCRLIPHFTHGE